MSKAPSRFAVVLGAFIGCAALLSAQTGAAQSNDQAVADLLPRDLSPWGMFLSADVFVKAVMVSLAFASLVTWTIALVKTLELATGGMRLRRQLAVLPRCTTLGDAQKAFMDRGGLETAVADVEAEIRSSSDLESGGLKERVGSLLTRTEARTARRLSRATGLIATIGATAPFVGLFGTVWGVMNSFIGISREHTTNLAVVAPGIAEALLATALGLAAAIPAVVIYNLLMRAISTQRARYADGAAAIGRLVSRDLDRNRLRANPRAVVGASGE
jgi:biopolymer transport protein ExbB